MHDGVHLTAQLSVNDNPTIKYHRRNNFTVFDFKNDTIRRLYKNEVESYLVRRNLYVAVSHSLQGQVQLADMVTRAVTNYTLNTLNLEPLLQDASDSLNYARFLQKMPTNITSDILDVFEAFGVFLYPISMNLQVRCIISAAEPALNQI